MDGFSGIISLNETATIGNKTITYDEILSANTQILCNKYGSSSEGCKVIKEAEKKIRDTMEKGDKNIPENSGTPNNNIQIKGGSCKSCDAGGGCCKKKDDMSMLLLGGAVVLLLVIASK